MDSHMDFVREALDFDRRDRQEREAWQAHAKARAERTITPPGPPELEARARAHLHTVLHGFIDWPEGEFQAAIDRNGSAVARHEQDHTAHADDFTDVDDTRGLCEFAHEHKPGDPLRTWGDAS